MRQLRIGIIASSEEPVDEPFAGGMEAHTATLAAGLRRRGHEVTVHAADRAGGAGKAPVAASPLELSDTARHDVSMPSERFMSEHHAYLSLMLALDEKGYDVVHNNSLHYLPVAMASGTRTPMVTTLHTPPTPWLESAIRCGPDRRLMSWVSVSAVNGASWSHLGMPVRTIHNGIDLSIWNGPEKPRLGMAFWSGRIVPEKGPHLAIEAARKAGYELELAGAIGDHEYFDREVKPRLGRGVRYLGHLASAELAAALRESEVCLATPCWEEPFGLVMVESLAAGTPVAAFDRGAVLEVLGPCGRTAKPGDVEGLAEAMRAASRIGRAECRRWASANFSAERMIDDYLAVYAEAMRSGSPDESVETVPG